MEAKDTITVAKNRVNPFQKAANFFGEVKQEFKRISWTSKKELIKFTKIILLATFSVSFVVYVVDIILQRALQFLSLLARWI